MIPIIECGNMLSVCVCVLVCAFCVNVNICGFPEESQLEFY